MRQDHLGETIGVSFQQIQKYERATNRVSAGRLYEICTTLDFPISQIFEGIKPNPSIKTARADKPSKYVRRSTRSSIFNSLEKTFLFKKLPTSSTASA